MADILLVAATTKEAGFLTSNIKKIVTGKRITVSESSKHKIDLLITGPGMVATTYHVAKALTAQNYQLAVNIGLCGSSIAEIKPGAVVNVTRDTFAGFGAEDGQAFIDIFDLGLMNVNDSPFQNKYLCSNFKQPTNSVKELRKVTGITVQKVTGSNASRKTLLKNYGPVTESMEGSAFFYVCLMEKIKCIQVRAVSNRIEKRNREKWKIDEAMSALNAFLALFLMELETTTLR